VVVVVLVVMIAVMIVTTVVVLSVFMALVAAVIVAVVAALLMTLIATFIATLAFLSALLFLPALALLLALVFLVALPLPGTNVPRLVFLGPYEIHLPVARMVLTAMHAPGPGVLRRNMQIQRFFLYHIRRRLHDDDRPGIDQSRRRPPVEIYTTVDTRRNLSANGH
jgi:hypothetical protein